MGVLAFTKTRGPGGWMSNMSAHRVEYLGRSIRTTEHLFQALRISPALEGDIVKTILDTPSPLAAKWAARGAITAGHAVVEPWSEADLDNMRLVVRLKTEQNPGVLEDLVATGDDVLIEDTTRRGRPDMFWGARNAVQDESATTQNGVDLTAWDAEEGSYWIGLNYLGQFWMDERKSRRLI